MTIYLIAGIAIGSVYALSAVGLVLLYRSTGTLNLAYGAMGAVGALIAWELVEYRLPIGIAALIGILITTGLSVGWGVTVGRRFSGDTALIGAIATLGAVLVVMGATSLRWNDDPRRLRLPTDSIGFFLADTRISGTQIIACALGVIVAAVATFVLKYSRFGAQMRALAEDRQLSSLLGVRVRAVDTIAWTVSGAISGVTAILLASMTTLSAANITFMIIPAIAVALIGGMKSLWWALIGGLLVGVLQAFATSVSELTAYSTAIPFVLAGLVTLWRGRHKIYSIRTSA